MKITLDLPSVLIGAAVALVLGLVAGFSPQGTQLPPQRPTDPTTMMSARPVPADFVWLEALQGNGGFTSPVYTVPQGKILVITALTGSSATSTIPFYIDGVSRSIQRYSINGGSGGGMINNRALNFGNGIPLAAGRTVELRPSLSGSTSYYFWLHGYLADA